MECLLVGATSSSAIFVDSNHWAAVPDHRRLPERGSFNQSRYIWIPLLESHDRPNRSDARRNFILGCSRCSSSQTPGVRPSFRLRMGLHSWRGVGLQTRGLFLPLRDSQVFPYRGQSHPEPGRTKRCSGLAIESGGADNPLVASR